MWAEKAGFTQIYRLLGEIFCKLHPKFYSNDIYDYDIQLIAEGPFFVIFKLQITIRREIRTKQIIF